MADANSTNPTVSAPDAVVKPGAPRVPAKYDRTFDTSRHSVEHVNGNQTDFTTETKSDDAAAGEFDNRVMELLDGELKARQVAEDKRANHRNRNRLLILLTVLILELVVPTLYGWHMLPSFFLKYEVLAITAPDALLTVYAYVRKY